jgi:hypothetical protein
MYDRNTQLNLLLDLEVRQDELLIRLEELDRRVELTLAEFQKLRAYETPSEIKSEAA